MNEESDSFEQRLKRQPVRPIPAEWRSEILKAVGEGQPIRQPTIVAGRSFLSEFNRRLAPMLWPHPVAWAGLAAVWMVILAVNYSVRDTEPAIAEKIAPISPEVMAELRQQERLFVELTGDNSSSDADRQNTFPPRPRSERAGLLTA